jgi:SMC interacting uncharacterized protein involved in chromosome segregation
MIKLTTQEAEVVFKALTNREIYLQDQKDQVLEDIKEVQNLIKKIGAYLSAAYDCCCDQCTCQD